MPSPKRQLRPTRASWLLQEAERNENRKEEEELRGGINVERNLELQTAAGKRDLNADRMFTEATGIERAWRIQVWRSSRDRQIAGLLSSTQPCFSLAQLILCSDFCSGAGFPCSLERGDGIASGWHARRWEFPLGLEQGG